jgi:DNA polymerase-3 subunit chi
MSAVCEVWFYHLERTSLDQALPELLEKTLKKGWKARVRAASQDAVDFFDDWLWRYRDEAFLPHARDTEAFAERQPVLLGTDQTNPNGAEALFLIDGAEPGDASPYQRCIVLFDGQDPAAVAQARGHWSKFKAQGLSVSYWQQGTERGWEKKA